jgi:hypothetical protein
VALASRGLASTCDLLVTLPAWGLMNLLIALAACRVLDLLVAVAALAVIFPSRIESAFRCTTSLRGNTCAPRVAVTYQWHGVSLVQPDDCPLS